MTKKLYLFNNGGIIGAMTKKRKAVIIAIVLISIILTFSVIISEFDFKSPSVPTEPFSGALWQRPLKNFATSLTVDDRKVFTTDDPGNVYCFDSQNGESLWNTSGRGTTRNPRPVISDGLFYFGYEERQVGCLDENTGNVLWTFQNTPAPEESSKGVSPRIIIKDDRLFAVSGTVSAHNATTGKLLWQAVPGRKNFDVSFSQGQMQAYPLHGDPFDGKYVYATGGNYSNLYFFKINTENGHVIWRSDATWGGVVVPFFGSSIPYPDVLAINQEKVIIRIFFKENSAANFFLCLHSTTGKELWSIDVGATIYNPTVHNNLLLFGAADGYFYALNLADGTIKWKTEVDTQNLFSSGVHSSSPIQIDSDNQRLFWSYAIEKNETSNYTGALISLDLNNGNVMWMTQTNSSCGGLAFNNGTNWLFLTTYRFAADIGLWIFNASTGDLIHNQQFDHYILSPIVIGKETFVAADLWLSAYS